MSKGKKVVTVDGAADGAGMSQWDFQNHPANLFEHHGQIGELRVMSVVVECVGTGTKQTKNGKVDFTKWAVREATLGEQKARPDGSDPAQPYLDDEYDEDDDAEPRPDLGDYVAGPDEDYAPPADQVAADFDGEGRAPETVRQLFSN